MILPIPKAAFDDRLAFTGVSGSGKTYAAGVCVEALLAAKHRVIVIDPLGVWYGLRLNADGKSKGFDVVVFGGPRGDLPLTEKAGALIGETAANMAESCILDLSQLGTGASERRFMLAFLTALYRKSSDQPVHLIFDEADMFAPQKVFDREGDANKLLGMMQTIVRRGRIKGFIPWLITQRPAVLSKDVLSQADGMVAMKLTSKHDRDAIGGWIEGQADKSDAKDMLAGLARLDRGHGLIWLPRHSILKEAAFPRKATFDSSSAPKRGKAAKATVLKPLDVGALRGRLASVEAEMALSDPTALRKKVAELTRQLAAQPTGTVAPDAKAIKDARQAGYSDGLHDGAAKERARIKKALTPVSGRLDRVLTDVATVVHAVTTVLTEEPAMTMKEPSILIASPPPGALEAFAAANRKPPRESVPVTGGLSGPHQRIVNAIRWWNVLGLSAPTHAQVAFIAGYSHTSGSWSTHLSGLRSAGMIEPKGLALTPEGRAHAAEPAEPPSGDALRRTVMAKISGPQRRILEPLIGIWPNGLSHEEAATAAGYSHTSGSWSTYLSGLRSLDLIEPKGELKAQSWLFPE